MELYCTYCGTAQGSRLSCCGENHWMTAEEYAQYNGDYPHDAPPEEFEAWLGKQTPGKAP
jgi:hypothetical protein